MGPYFVVEYQELTMYRSWKEEHSGKKIVELNRGDARNVIVCKYNDDVIKLLCLP